MFRRLVIRWKLRFSDSRLIAVGEMKEAAWEDYCRLSFKERGEKVRNARLRADLVSADAGLRVVGR